METENQNEKNSSERLSAVKCWSWLHGLIYKLINLKGKYMEGTDNKNTVKFFQNRKIDYNKINQDNLLEFMILFTKHANFFVSGEEAIKEMENFLIEE